jgi:hypothetical protein
MGLVMTEIYEEDEKEIREQLDNLVANCSEFEELERELSRFNFFEALRASRDEKTHSEFLKWLLDPLETHGLGDLFLKKFLKKVVVEGKEIIEDDISAADIDIVDLNNSFVRREEPLLGKGPADITISNESGEKIYCLIENKIKSGLGENQLRRYYEGARDKYPNHAKIFVYLNPEGNGPPPPQSDLPYVPLGYRDLRELIRDLLKQKGAAMSESVSFMIKQYLSCVEVDVLGAKDLDELCLEIYQAHRKAINRIVESIPGDIETYEALGERVTKELGPEWRYKAKGSYCSIFKKDWLEKLANVSWSDLSVVHYTFTDLGRNSLKIGFQTWVVKEEKDFRDKFRKILKNVAEAQLLRRNCRNLTLRRSRSYSAEELFPT